VGGECGPRYQTFRREELENLGIKWERMEKAFEEGQGPHKVVEPVMMMNIIGWLVPYFLGHPYHSQSSFNAIAATLNMTSHNKGGIKR
jgi:hypothetical protein